MQLSVTLYAGLALGPLLYCLIVVFLASVVRGYSGFGLAALLVTSLSLVLSPAEVVPIALLMELAASAVMARKVWRYVAWPSMGWLLLGAALGTPIGVTILAVVPPDPMRIAISLLVLAACGLLWIGYSYRGQPGWRAILAAGGVSGVANGVAALGGLPLVIFLLSIAAEAAVARATLIVYLLLINAYGTVVYTYQGLIGFEVLLRSGIFLGPMVAGVAIGNRHFLNAAPGSFRRFTLILLMVLSLLGLGRALL